MELQRIGRYDIKSLIGQGGMSAVYLGYDPRSQREVAIKILPPYYLHSSKFRERFEREALMIALLEHPAIVPVYDMGEEDGQPYIVMRYMSGGSLADKLKKGPIPLRECMDMYLRLAPALDTAHARGVTHRDVKPDNLLFDKYDNVFLSDFGLARLRETIGFANISDGSIMGTPAYMSPEQIQGDQEIDGRSDIYSMGVVLYQMLSATVPYFGTTAASVMMMHLVNPVPQIYEKNNTLPTGIQVVLETAMAKKPEDRYQSAGDFAKAIQAVTTGVQRKPTFHNLTSSSPAQRTGSSPNHLTPPQIPADITNQVSTPPANPAQANHAQTPIPGAIPPVQKPAAALTGSTPARPDVRPKLSTSHPGPLLKRKQFLPVWGWIVSAAVLLVLSLVLILWSQGVFSFTSLPESIGNPDNSNIQNSPSPQTTEVVSSQSLIVLGQADKIAFVKSSDIWVSNLDGSELVQLTTDGGVKKNLHWSPDGQSVIYTSANCIDLVGLQTRQIRTLTCFTGISSINAFDVSPDGQRVALGLADSNLYLLPYTQLFSLRQTSLPEDIQSLAQCSYYAPYNTGEALKAVNWSISNSSLLAILLSTLMDGTNRDEVSILDFDQCTAAPVLVEEILPTYFLFNLRGYYDYPKISSLSWNANNQLLVNGFVNREGFGDLQLYDLSQNQGQELAPNGDCCYRDAHWSPDGTYLFYSYQAASGGDISLYYTPSSELSQPGGSMASLALPSGFLTGSMESLQPALRTAH
jgi:serine/threonine-protein kinase